MVDPHPSIAGSLWFAFRFGVIVDIRLDSILLFACFEEVLD